MRVARRSVTGQWYESGKARTQVRHWPALRDAEPGFLEGKSPC
jgi:hypothetical protein